MQRAFLLIYSFFYIIALIFLLPIEYFKRPSRIKKRWLKEKFGLFKKNLTHTTSLSSQPKIWIHAVSVGEVIAISNLIKKLTNKYEIVLSTITDTGQKVATDKFKDYPVRVIYLPFDVNFAIRRTIKFFNVSLLILTETELWPNLIFFSSKKIPVVLVNGRLSEKSFKGYKKIRFFIRHLINKLNLICVQDETYRDRFIKIGAKEEKLHITGNMKFDIEIEKIPFNWESCIPRPVIIAGSTHEP